MASVKIRAKSLWSGDRFSLESEGTVYVVKTYKQPGSDALVARSERRVTSMTHGFLGVGRRWKTWDELSTPVEDQDLEQEVMKISW